ncbi:MAG TPA: PDZ domain-containing protein, partial [Vampirovibrionales bacterium]
GGALVNTKGDLVGINAAIKSNTGSFAGYSFAIPSNIVKKVVSDLKEFGTVQRAFIGINIRNIDENLAEEIGIDDYSGVYVAGLAEFGSAKEAGIKEGDIIKSIEGIEVNTVTELQAKVGEYRPGDKIEVVLTRDGIEQEKMVILKNLEGNTSIITGGKSALMKELGAKFSTIDEELKEELSISGGVQVEEIFSGKFKNAGVREGFIITKVDKSSVKSSEELVELLEDKKGGVLLQGVYPNGREAYYGIGM